MFKNFEGEIQHMMKAKSILNRFLKEQSGEGFLDVASASVRA